MDDHDPSTGRAWCDIAPESHWTQELDATVLSEAVRRVLARRTPEGRAEGSAEELAPVAWVPVRAVRVGSRGRSGRIGTLLLSISEEDNRLQALVDACWEQMFATPLYRAYCELVAASQRDEELARALSAMLRRVMMMFEPAANHYFETSGTKLRPADLFMQLSCVLSGLGLQAPLLDQAVIRSQLNGWVRQTSPLLRARKGVTQPPPRPASWDRILEG